MIWIDFGIICIGQENASSPPNAMDFCVEGYLRTVDSKPFYNEKFYHFSTADKIKGCWYTIWLREPTCYDESIFDISQKGVPCVEVLPKWTEYVQQFLSFYLQQSPVHKIAVLLRVEDASDDVVHSSCSLENFMQRLKEGEIRWNELYYVQL